MTTTRAPDFQELARMIVETTAHAPVSIEEPTPRPGDPSSLDETTGPVDGISFDGPGAMTHRLEDLPKELGVLLASVGILGVVLPGIAGTPALIAGGLVLWPRTFGNVEAWFESRFPMTHRKSMRQVGRFLDDLDRRYPQAGKP